MKISIVTPSYNQGEFLEQTIDSVLSQNYRDLEYIIIDGGSTDNSVEIIKKYAKHLHYWVSEKDSGQSVAINKGLRLAGGEIFNWLNSDDYYEPGTLLKVAELFRDENVNVVAGKSRIFFPDGNAYFSHGTDIYPQNLAKTIGCSRIDQPETFFRKACIDAIGGVQEHLHYIMDRDVWIRYLLTYGLGHIKKVDDIFVNFRVHANSKTNTHQENFTQERANYFYSIAEKGRLSESACIINQVYKCQRIPTPTINDLRLLKSIIAHYLFLEAEEWYQKDHKSRARHFLNSVDESLLDSITIQQYRKIQFRNRYLPLWLIHAFRQKSNPA